MPAVRMTHQMRQEIQQNAVNGFTPRIEQINREVIASLTPSQVVDAAFLAYGLGNKWSKAHSEEARQSTFIKNSPRAVVQLQQVQVTVTLNTPGERSAFHWDPPAPYAIYWPYVDSSRWSSKSINDGLNLTFDYNKDTGAFSSRMPELLEWLNAPEQQKLRSTLARFASLMQEKKDFLTEVKRLADSVNSLRQFLQAWPRGESLVNESDLERLRETAQKRKKLKPEDLLDENTGQALTKTVTINRVLTGLK